jgi:hypothetical protein
MTRRRQTPPASCEVISALSPHDITLLFCAVSQAPATLSHVNPVHSTCSEKMHSCCSPGTAAWCWIPVVLSCCCAAILPALLSLRYSKEGSSTQWPVIYLPKGPSGAGLSGNWKGTAIDLVRQPAAAAAAAGHTIIIFM